jgi:hypothetical protein
MGAPDQPHWLRLEEELELELDDEFELELDELFELLLPARRAGGADSRPIARAAP